MMISFLQIKKIKILLLLLVAFTINGYGQQAKVTTILHFKGSIASYPIEMKLEIAKESDSITGSYYYLKNGDENQIYLAGTIKDGEVLLTESAYSTQKKKYEQTGLFRLAYVAETNLNGSWQKDKNTAQNKMLTVKLSCRENLKAFNPSSHTFLFSRNKVKIPTLSETGDPYYQIVLLKVLVNKSMRWIFTEFDKNSLAKDATIEVEDLNFDGLLDFKVPINFPERSKGDFAFLYFIYNPVTKGFNQYQQLNDMEFLLFDPVKKEVLKVDADGNGNETYAYYQWYKQKIVLVREVKLYENDPFTHTTTYQIINGKSVKLKTVKTK